ncbi:MAG TPA: DUF3618 domain-containing protein [Paracoccaceae bacterium]|nr:DUF3618 domain-containing protein [Paracoccaceae bacterium]
MSNLPEQHAHTGSYARGDRSPAALAREIEAERRNVAQTIEALQEKFAIGNIAEEAWDQYGHQAREMGRNLGQAVTRNPLPVALTAIGLVWLIVSSRRDEYGDDDHSRSGGKKLYEEDFVGIRSEESGARRPYGTAAVTGFYEPRRSLTERVSGAVGNAYEAAKSTVDPALERVRASGESIAGSARNAVGAATEHADDAGHGAGNRIRRAAGAARDYAEGALESGREAVEAVGDRARHARDRASHRAHEAAERAGHYRRQGRRQAEIMVRDHPLLLGFAALTIGAGIACMLPRSRAEDEYLGEYSDRAWELAREEAEKARRVAGAVVEEAREIADEEYEALKTGVRAAGEDLRQELSDSASDLAQRATDEAGTALEEAGSEAVEIAERLGDAARDEAERQGLVDPDRSA